MAKTTKCNTINRKYYICAGKSLGTAYVIPENKETMHIWGEMELRKEIKDDCCNAYYTAEHRIFGFLNERNRAKPVSVTKYSHYADIGIMSAIPVNSIIKWEYFVNRVYYNPDIKGIYSFVKDISVKKYLKPGALLFTEISLIDTLSKLTIAGKDNDTNFDFNYLENSINFKQNQNIKNVGYKSFNFSGIEIMLNGYCRTGTGSMPIYYWFTREGLLTVIKHPISTVIFKGVYEDGE